MKRIVLGVITSMAFAVAAVEAQTQNPPTQQQQQQQQQQQPPPTQPPTTPTTPQTIQSEVTYVGCIVQGSTPTVFILENAKKDPADQQEKAISYVLATDLKDLAFRPHLNHEVRILGTLEQRTPPVVVAGEKVAEKDMLKFTAKEVTVVSDRCTP